MQTSPFDGTGVGASANAPTGPGDGHAAAFSRALQEARSYQLPTAPGRLVLTRCTSPFPTLHAAMQHALDDANPKSVNSNTEFGGLAYARYDETGNRTYGYTGPYSEDRASGLELDNPLVRLPSEEVRFVGTYHAHGDYNQLDPATGDVLRTDRESDMFSSDSFSRGDLNNNIAINNARTWTLERRTETFVGDFGALPDDNVGPFFFLGTPVAFHEGEPYLVHDPNAVATEYDAATDPGTGEVVQGGGTVRPLLQDRDFDYLVEGDRDRSLTPLLG